MIIYDEVADARIVRVSICPDASRVEFLFVNQTSKIQWRLTASGLKELMGWEIRKSNVIDSIVVYSGEECAQSNVLELVDALQNGDPDTTMMRDGKKMNVLLDSLQSGHASLVSFEAAYGAEFILIAERIEFNVYNAAGLDNLFSS